MQANYPSPDLRHRRADKVVHAVGLLLILGTGTALLAQTFPTAQSAIIIAVVVYIACNLASNLSSATYHFSPRHDRRVQYRRVDHAAIYLSITGTFTPFFVFAGTTWTWGLLVICWALTILAVWNKITNPVIKSRWSTASYLALGAIGLSALPDLGDVPAAARWLVLAGAVSYVIGTVFYTRRALPYRYAIWHGWCNLGGLCMFAGLWLTLFS